MATVTIKAIDKKQYPQVLNFIMPTETKESARARAESWELTKYKIIKVE